MLTLVVFTLPVRNGTKIRSARASRRRYPPLVNEKSISLVAYALASRLFHSPSFLHLPL
jgi:hypothetical protein